jgi:DNA-binding GntR family transcriptional regulator
MTAADRTAAPLARRMLSAQVKDTLLQWILEGRLRPGARIIETKVARELGTSQAPVREALRDLATLGLVEMDPFRGARVREPTAEELVEAMELRGELEAIGARTAVLRMGERDLEHLSEILDEMRASAADDDAHGQAVQNRAFHAAIIAASGNRTLQRLWTMLEPFARSYLTATVPGADLAWLAERHATIIGALRSGDPDRAAEAMRVHAREAESQVLRSAHPLGGDADATAG